VDDTQRLFLQILRFGSLFDQVDEEARCMACGVTANHQKMSQDMSAFFDLKAEAPDRSPDMS